MSARHYFTQESAARWSFFHNSFRQFLIRKTSIDPLGRHSADRDQHYHRALADLAAASPGSGLAWDRLYHLSAAGDQDAISAGFSPLEARAQYLAGRNGGGMRTQSALGLADACKSQKVDNHPIKRDRSCQP